MTGPLRTPLRLLAIDPALAHTGILIADVTGYAQVTPLRAWTCTTTPGTPVVERIQTTWSEVGLALDTALPEIERPVTITPGGAVTPVCYAVIEDPEGHGFRRRARHDRNEVRGLGTVHYLGAAFGAALTALAGAVDPPRLTVAPVSRWYPRAGRGFAKKGAVVARARRELGEQLGRVSEHVCMAYALATWWSCNVAPAIWNAQPQPTGGAG